MSEPQILPEVKAVTAWCYDDNGQVFEYVSPDDATSLLQQAREAGEKAGVAKERERCFPNPLQLHVDSHILVSHFTDADGGCGVLFQDTGKEHKTGELYPEAMLERPHTPQQGELYIRFKDARSAVVVLEALTVTICHLMGFQDRAAVEAKIKEMP